MGEKTNIEWCDSTASPWTGCSKVSLGCANCYAADLAKRYGWCEWGPGKPRHKFKGFAENCRKWNRYLTCDCGAVKILADLPTNIAACPKCKSAYRKQHIFPSLMDWLDKEVPIAWLAEFLQVIHECQNLDLLLLTKRIENFTDLLLKVCGLDSVDMWVSQWLADWHGGKAPANVWLGVSIEDQQRADERIPELLKIPAKVHFLSVEPILGSVNLKLTDYLGPQPANAAHIDWVIVGGESGRKARPCNIEWIRFIVQQCKAAGVPCYVKQLGSNPVGHSWNPEFSIYIDHPKGGDSEEWPEDLRVREMPR